MKHQLKFSDISHKNVGINDVTAAIFGLLNDYYALLLC